MLYQPDRLYMMQDSHNPILRTIVVDNCGSTEAEFHL